MKDRKLASRYARALIAALPEPASQDRAGEFLDALVESLKTNGALRAALLDPAVPGASKAALLDALVAAKGASPEVARFLATVAAHRRIANLASIAETFREERERAQGAVSGTLTTAAPISDDLAARAAAALSKLAGRTVRLELQVDPRLMGGAVARVGSMLFDGSVKSQLDQLRHRIGEE